MSAASEMGSTYPPLNDLEKASIPIYDFQQILEGITKKLARLEQNYSWKQRSTLMTSNLINYAFNLYQF